MPLMVGNVLRNLFGKPATRAYPTESRDPFPGTRGRIKFIAEDCDFCGDCERACPSRAIVLDTVLEEAENRSAELVWVRIYKPYRCIMCNRCVEVCPYNALKVVPEYTMPATDRVDIYDQVESW